MISCGNCVDTGHDLQQELREGGKGELPNIGWTTHNDTACAAVAATACCGTERDLNVIRTAGEPWTKWKGSWQGGSKEQGEQGGSRQEALAVGRGSSESVLTFGDHHECKMRTSSRSVDDRQTVTWSQITRAATAAAAVPHVPHVASSGHNQLAAAIRERSLGVATDCGAYQTCLNVPALAATNDDSQSWSPSSISVSVSECEASASHLIDN